jgi:hypothetical protein
MKVGITGHQQLGDPAQWEWVRQEMDQVLVALPSPLIGISSLAVGADQLFANAILKHDGTLEAIIPFAEYESTFVSDRDREEFKRLLSLAAKTETLEKNGSDEEAYFAAGKRVVDRSDLVIAVWDGKPAKGLGGTGDVARYALQRQKRIVHLNPTRRNCAYDVFVSYRHAWPDRPWVRKRLVPALEDAGLSVWLDVRDGDLAQDIYSQTDEVIKKSRHAVCVISPSYAREEKKRARMVAVEVRRLLELEHAGEGPAITPLWLRGRKMPGTLGSCIAFDWRRSKDRAQQWKKFLAHLAAANLNSPPPPCREVCLHWWLMISAYAACLTLLIAALMFSASRVNKLQTLPKTRVHLSMQKIAGANITEQMRVPASGNVTGVVEGTIPAGARVAIYTQAFGDHDLWQYADSTLLNGSDWTVAEVPFRQPLAEHQTRTTIQAVVVTSEPPETLSNDELLSLKQDTTGELSSVTVETAAPQVMINGATLDSDGAFTAFGTASNILAAQEQLYFEIEGNNFEKFKKNATGLAVEPNWKVRTRLKDDGKPVNEGETFTVQVFLETTKTSGASRIPFPTIFTAKVIRPQSAGTSQ